MTLTIKSWKYMRSVVLDGNFTAQHRRMKKPEDDVALADGHSYMVTDAPYKQHLKTAAESKPVSEHILIASHSALSDIRKTPATITEPC